MSAKTPANIPDIKSVFKGVENLLDEDGIYITEDPYLLDVFKKVSYGLFFKIYGEI